MYFSVLADVHPGESSLKFVFFQNQELATWARLSLPAKVTKPTWEIGLGDVVSHPIYCLPDREQQSSAGIPLPWAAGSILDIHHSCLSTELDGPTQGCKPCGIMLALFC